jgi:hypothetical protein
VSRTRNAAVAAAFSHLQYALVVASGLIVFPITVGFVGAYDYGLWLATGEVVGYLVLLDPGVFAVLPWLVASADGAGDPARIRRYLVDGLAAGVVMGLVLAGAAAAVWFVPSAGGLISTADLNKVRGPLVLQIAFTAATYPFKPFAAALIGLQDVTFSGAAAVAQTVLTAVLTIGLLSAGYGLTGLVLALGLPTLLVGAGGVVRLSWRVPHMLQGWGWPRPAGVWHLAVQGSGSWLGSMGTRLAAASNGIILAAAGHPEWATLYAASGKAAQLLQQACWLIPDSGLVGLAQLHGQGDRHGTRRTVACMIHLHVLISGGAMLGLLAFNPAFVRAWVGPALYAGDSVNVLLAANLFVAALVHGALTSVGAVSHRLLVGLLTLGFGALYCGLAFGLAAVRGVGGLVEASLLSSCLLGLIPGLAVVGRVHGYGWRPVLAEAVGPWLARSAPLLITAAWLGAALGGRPAWQPAAVGLLLGAVYLWRVRPLVAAVPWPVRARPWLLRLRLVPAAPGES